MVAAHLAEVVQLLVRGDAPLEIAPHMAGAALHALPKPGGDVRPIAVGETLRRLASKCLCQAVREPAQRWLSPLQLGVAVSLGAEAAVHTARNWFHRNSGHANKAFLTIDFENAFNSVDRAAMLREVRLRLPGLAPYAEWCYGHHSRLLFDGEPLTSEAGVQQGDPLGPLLFSLAVQPALRAVRSGPWDQQPELAFAYLDDVCLAGSLPQLRTALARLTAAARQVGLALNPAKCKLITTSHDGLVDPHSFPAGLTIDRSGAFTLLGAAIGGHAFCTAHTQSQRVDASKPLLEALGHLDDPQTGLLLLRECASFCKVAYSARVTPPALHTAALSAFDAEVRTCLEALCTGPLPGQAWAQASLSTSAGGLGLRLASRHASAGFLASTTATEELCKELDPHYMLSVNEVVDAFNRDVLPGDRIPSPVPNSLSQQKLSRALDAAAVAELSAPRPGQEATRAHLQLLQQPGAGAWLHAPPADNLGLHVDPALFRIMVCLRLRLPVASEDVACPLCDAVADRMGDHARACPCGGDRTKRHHRLRSILASRAQAGGLNPVVEKAGLLPPRLDLAGAPEDGVQANGGGGRRPADVWVGNWGAHGPAAFDLAVTSGLRQGAVAASAATGARAAEDYEARKRAHLQTAATCANEGLQFIPLVAEAASGGWAPVAMQTWRQLAHCVAARTGEEAGAELGKLLQTLAISLQRENARAVLRRVGGSEARPATLADP